VSSQFQARIVSLIDGLCLHRWHLDRLRDAMLPGDSAKWVEYAPVLQTTGLYWKGREMVVVNVWPRGRMEEQ
jgi:hypothetical protein